MNKDHSPKPSFRQGLGLPVERGFLPGPSPCPVDIELIRALHDGKLSREVELEIRDLTLAYREWADASQAVLHAMTATRTTEDDTADAMERRVKTDNRTSHFLEIEQKDTTSPETLDNFKRQAADYLRMDVSELRSKLSGHDKAYRSGDPLAPYRAELRELICDAWNWNAHRDDELSKDELAMAGILALLISESQIPFPFPIAMIAALLVREGLDNLCNPFR